MKPLLPSHLALAACAAFLFTAEQSHARAYGTTAGGRSYAAGPRGVAVSGPNGAAAAGRYGGAAVAGPNGAAAVGRYGGAAAVSTSGAVVATRPVAVPTTIVATRPVAAPLPAGYIRTVPAGYTTVVYGGYNCMFVGGVYYRPVMYQGSTVYVVVNP
ncbi:MAG: hypothetical protein K8R23_08985 [Chthoniobacter sp.]|nr:hypothetical protein [Chthoniobacter sp.]